MSFEKKIADFLTQGNIKILKNFIPDDFHEIINRLSYSDNNERLFYIGLIRGCIAFNNLIMATTSYPLLRGIFTGLLYFTYDPLVKKTSQLDKEAFTKFMNSEFSLLEKHIDNQLINNFSSTSEDTKILFELSFEKFYASNLSVWNRYTELYFQFIRVLSEALSANILPIIQNKSFNSLNIILTNLYFAVYYYNLIKGKKEVNKETQKQINEVQNNFKKNIKDIFKNTNIICENNSLNLHSSDAFSILLKLLDIGDDHDFDKPFFLSSSYSKVTKDWFNPSYIFSLLFKDPYALAIVIGKFPSFDDAFISVEYFNHALNDYKSLNDLIASEYEKVDKNILMNDQDILFSIENMSLQFNDYKLFNNINIQIPRSKWIFLNGKSGCGKTTFLKVLLKLIVHSSGKISYLNEFENYTYNNLKSEIHFVNSDSDIFNNSIYYNCTYGIKNISELTKPKLKALLNLFGMEEYADNLEFNCELLSFGQRQRIRIIRLILSDRKIWFFDEFTSNLNYEMEEFVLTKLKEIQIAQKISVIHISHNQNNIKFADHRIYINKDGMSLI